MVTTLQGSRAAPLPSSEELFRTTKQPAFLTDEARRLCWVLDGPLTTAITVLKQPYHDPDTTPEPYFTSEGNEPTWHAVSQAPYTDPKISSVTVSVIEIDEWEEHWRDIHRGHTTPPDDGDGEDDDDWDFPSECCGEQRPSPQAMKLVVKASEQFVTVHDYVSAVHPWLIRKYDDLLRALAVIGDEPLSLRAGEHLMVSLGGPESLSIGVKEDWLRNKDKKVYLQSRQRPVEEQLNLDRPGGSSLESSDLERDQPDGRPPGHTGPWPPPYAGAYAPLGPGAHVWGTPFPKHWNMSNSRYSSARKSCDRNPLTIDD
jgi:hypothetical protein